MVIPLKTLPPVYSAVKLLHPCPELGFALSITLRLGNINALAICAQNSTAIPTQITRFTRDSIQ
jgi:hypothetical protein